MHPESYMKISEMNFFDVDQEIEIPNDFASKTKSFRTS